MTKLNINQTGSVDPIKVRRRNKGETYEQTNVSLPIPLKQKINGIIVETGDSRSKVITDLLKEAFDARETSE